MIALAALLLAGSAAAAEPVIHPRSAWGAIERVAGRRIRYNKDSAPERITIHHTDIAVPEDQRRLAERWLELSPDRRAAALAASQAQAAEYLRAVQRLHFSKGFDDIGYHYMIDWMGRVYEGRPVGALGAHAEEENRGNLGIALLGDFERQEPSVSQQAALERLVRYLSRKHRIPRARILAHRDIGNTACPGRRFYSWVADARSGRLARGETSPDRAVKELLKPWVPGRPALADSRLAQRVFDSLLPH